MDDGFVVCFSVLLWRCEWEQLRLRDPAGHTWLTLHWECDDEDPKGIVSSAYLNEIEKRKSRARFVCLWFSLSKAFYSCKNGFKYFKIF
jgi:hypothetical protein